MSHPPQTPDPNLPSALTQLFAEGEHFLRPSEDMLIDPGLEDSQTVAAIAAAAAEQAAEHAAQEGHTEGEQEHHQLEHQPLDQMDQPLTQDFPGEMMDIPAPEKQSALEVLAAAMRAENDRLRRAVTHLEAQGLGQGLLEGALPALPLEMDVDDLGISQHTLRELASAAASESFLSLESLQHLQVEEVNPASMADFLHGLVAQVTVPRGGEARVKVDPFEVARKSIEAEIEATRAAIAEKETEIAAAKSANGEKEGGEKNGPEPQDKAALDAQLAKVTTALDGARARAAVLRDAVLRVKRERDAAHFAVRGMEAELAVMGDGGRAQASARAIRDVRSYLDDVLKNYKEVNNFSKESS